MIGTGRRRPKEKKLHPWQRKRRRVLLYMVFGPLVILIAVLAWRLHQRKQVDIRLDAIRAEGLPVTLEELNAWYPAVPDAENAALLYIAAGKALRIIEPAKLERLEWLLGLEPEVAHNEPYSPEIRALFEEYLEANAEALDLLHQAAALPRCRYPADFTLGYATNLSHIKPLKELVRLLCLQIIWIAENGNSEQVSRAVLDALAATRSLKEEPLYFSQMIRMECEGMIVQALMRVFSRHQLDAASARQLQAAFAEHEYPGNIIRVLVSERCMVLPFITDTVPYDGFPRVSAMLRPELAIRRAGIITGLGDLSLIHYVDAYDKIMATAQLPRHEALDAGDQAEQFWTSLPWYSRMLMRMIGPGWRVHQQFAEGEANLRLAQAALAVERYRIEHASLPETLDALVPNYMDEVPLDPFDGQPLRYRITPTGYLLYSVGGNRIDDDGEGESQPVKFQWKGDHLFEVMRS